MAACAAARRATGTPVRRAADVVQPQRVTEADRCRVAAVLATDANFQVAACLAAFLDGDGHQAAHTFRIEGFEGVDREDLLLDVFQQDLALRVDAREAEGRLDQVMGAEGEDSATLAPSPAVNAARDLHQWPPASSTPARATRPLVAIQLLGLSSERVRMARVSTGSHDRRVPMNSGSSRRPGSATPMPTPGDSAAGNSRLLQQHPCRRRTV